MVPLLLKTSIVTLVVTGLSLLCFRKPKPDPFLVTLFTVADCTSIANHGMTSDVVKFVDRSVMVVGFCSKCYYMYYFETPQQIVLTLPPLLISVSSFFISKTKYQKRFRFLWHANSHMFLIITNTIQLYIHRV